MTGRTATGQIPLPEEAQVRCGICEQPLYFLPEAYPLAFHCGNGHDWTSEDLLDEFIPVEKASPSSALEFWHGVSRLFHDLAGRALEGHHTLIAADFQETAVRIDRWEDALRRLLKRRVPPSTVPESPAPRTP